MGRIGVLIAVEAEKPESREKVIALAQKLAMHIAAASPKYLSLEHMPAAEVAKESDVFRAQATKMGNFLVQCYVMPSINSLTMNVLMVVLMFGSFDRQI
jgi:translation elongation factor EF-Ts